MNVKIFPGSEPILLPLAPTIAGTIAAYLELMTQALWISSPQNFDNIGTKLSIDGLDLTEIDLTHLICKVGFAESIRQVPTLQYQYVSTIAHRLAAKSSLTPLEVCQNLQSPLQSANRDPGDRGSSLELCCWYNHAGYIYFQIAADQIATWLNWIHDLPLAIDLSGASGAASDQAAAISSLAPINIAIYAHARCCARLNLAQTEKLVTIAANWQISTPKWLPIQSSYRQDRLTAASTSIFAEPAERQLIYTLMAVLDRIYDRSSQLGGVNQGETEKSTGRFDRQNSSNWTKLTIDLAVSWLEFDRHCRIFGDLKRQNPSLAIARCGLTAISRRYLQVLLENYLGVKAVICL